MEPTLTKLTPLSKAAKYRTSCTDAVNTLPRFPIHINGCSQRIDLSPSRFNVHSNKDGESELKFEFFGLIFIVVNLQEDENHLETFPVVRGDERLWYYLKLQNGP